MVLFLILCFYWFYLCVHVYMCISLCYFCFILVCFLNNEKEGMELEGGKDLGDNKVGETDQNILNEKLFSIKKNSSSVPILYLQSRRPK